MPSTRTSVARLALAAAPLLVAAAVAAPAHAQTVPAPAPAPKPSSLQPVVVPATTIAEGRSVRIAVPLTCSRGKGSCSFRIGTLDGTATAAGDYAARGVNVVLRAGQSKTVGFTVKAVADTTCEPAETFTVQVQSTRGKARRADAATVTIMRDADVTAVCAKEAARDEVARAETGGSDEAAMAKADAGIE